MQAIQNNDKCEFKKIYILPVSILQINSEMFCISIIRYPDIDQVAQDFKYFIGRDHDRDQSYNQDLGQTQTENRSWRVHYVLKVDSSSVYVMYYCRWDGCCG